MSECLTELDFMLSQIREQEGFREEDYEEDTELDYDDYEDCE